MVHIRSGRPRGPADGLGRPYVERQHHEGCRDRGILPDPGACGVYMRVPVHHACIRAIAPPYSRNHSICTPAGRRPSTASPCQHQHRRVVGETRSPPRLEHARHGYDRRGRDGQAAGPQRPSLRLQSCWPPAPSRRARLAVHTVGASFGPSSRNLDSYSEHDVLAIGFHSFAASRALRACNRYRKTKTSQSVRIPQIFATLDWTKSPPPAG